MKTKCLLYCTMAKPYLYARKGLGYYVQKEQTDWKLNGTIVAECEVECEEIEFNTLYDDEFEFDYHTKTLDFGNLVSSSKITYEQMNDYLGNKNGYALHINNLKVFDKPLELSEVKSKHKFSYGEDLLILRKAPQNMMWVWYKGERYCLISIRSQWVCKILNGEKPIEVRKKIMKGMI